MKTIICGSRTIKSYAQVLRAIDDSGFTITEIVCGAAAGPDTLGSHYGCQRGLPIKYFRPDWDKFGKSAGYRRNAEMVEYAEAVIAIWDGVSKGTKHTIDLAKARGLKVFVRQVKLQP